MNAPRKLTIEIQGNGEAVRLDAFVRFLGRTLTTLESVAELAQRDRQLVWTIEKISMNSPIAVLLRAESDGIETDAEPTVAAFTSGIMGLETGSRETPKDFNTHALRAAKDMLNVLVDQEMGIKGLTFSSNDGADAITVTPKARETAKYLLEGGGVSIGGVEGTLETLTLRGGPKIFLHDRITKTRIACTFASPEIGETAHKLWGKRVLVTGRLTLSVDGHPTRIDAEDIEYIGEPDTVVPFDGIPYIDFGEDFDVVMAVREIRDEERLFDG